MSFLITASSLCQGYGLLVVVNLFLLLRNHLCKISKVPTILTEDGPSSELGTNDSVAHFLDELS